MKELNLEDGHPTVVEAMALLKDKIKSLKKGEIIVLIHGYGSSGKGGKIRVEARSWLKAQERNGKLSKVVEGEEFEMFNFKAMELKNRDKALIEYYGKGNHGVTIVEK